MAWLKKVPMQGGFFAPKNAPETGRWFWLELPRIARATSSEQVLLDVLAGMSTATIPAMFTVFNLFKINPHPLESILLPGRGDFSCVTITWNTASPGISTHLTVQSTISLIGLGMLYPHSQVTCCIDVLSILELLFRDFHVPSPVS